MNENLKQRREPGVAGGAGGGGDSPAGSQAVLRRARSGPASLAPPGKRRHPFLRWLHRHPAGAPVIVLIVSMAVFEALNQRFLRPEDISLMLQQLAVLGCLAIGQTVIMLTAGIDFSVGAVMILAQMVMAELAVNGSLPVGVALLLGVMCGALAGGINGGLAAPFGLPPFIATLGTLGVFTAVSLRLSLGMTIFFPNPNNLLLWTGNVVTLGRFNVTTGVFLMLALYLLVAYMLGGTAWGRSAAAPRPRSSPGSASEASS